MLISEAIELISNKDILNSGRQIWADLGCGSGTFTMALANLLPAGSKIYAVDKNGSSLNRIPVNYCGVHIEKIRADFLSAELPENLDGILMANSLHYVADKESFSSRAHTGLKAGGVFLIVEYDTGISNHWVPFPINYNSLKILFEKSGQAQVTKLNEMPSVFRKEKIYSALIKFSLSR